MSALAVYGAVVGSLALLWNVYTWRKSRVTRVEVLIEYTPMYGDADADADDEPTAHLLVVRVVNYSSHPVRLIELGFSDSPKARPEAYTQIRSKPIPAWDMFEVIRSLPDELIDTSGPVAGWIQLSTGEWFSSRSTVSVPETLG